MLSCHLSCTGCKFGSKGSTCPAMLLIRSDDKDIRDIRKLTLFDRYVMKSFKMNTDIDGPCA